MTSISLVRTAIPADEPEIWRLFRAAHAESDLFPSSDAKVKYYLDRIFYPERIAEDDAGPRGIIGVIGPVGALEGIVMLVLWSPWYSEQIAMGDCTNYVDQAHRVSGHAAALMKYCKDATDIIRETEPNFRLVIGVLSTKRTAAKVRLCEKHFGYPVGAMFLYPDLGDAVHLKNGRRENKHLKMAMT